MSVMSTKMGTKTWTDSSAGSDLKLDQSQTKLTDEQKRALGAENIGEVLNKVSDPGYVDPSKKVRGTGNKEMDKDAFFKLMLAQLKHQDPTNPLKNHEMAAQLAQFSTLEQMSNVNKTLEEMKNGSKPVEQFQALNLIGKQVAGDAARVTRQATDKEHQFLFKLPQDIKTAEIKVMNSKGDIVREFKFNELKAGDNKVMWNGEMEDGRKAPAGEYTFQTEAVDAQGKKVQVKTEFDGIITGMSFSNEGPVLQIGKQTVRLKDIRQFSDPGLKSNDQNAKDVTELDLKNGTQQRKNDIKEETKTAAQKKAIAASTGDVLADVGMSQGLLNKLTNDVSKSLENKEAQASQVAKADVDSDADQGAF